MINVMVNESMQLYILAKQRVQSGKMIEDKCVENFVRKESTICDLSAYLRDVMKEPKINYYVSSSIEKASNSVIHESSTFIRRLPMMILNILLTIIMTFFILTNAETLIAKSKQLVPLKKSYRKEILKQFSDMIFALVYGQLIIAVLQGVIGTIVFTILGISSPVIWGIIMAILSFIPIVGTPIIWIPAMILKYLSAHPYHAFALLLMGIIQQLVEHVLKPAIVGTRVKIHVLFILLGILGGIHLFGVLGFVVGPVIVAIFISAIKMYEDNKSEAKS